MLKFLESDRQMHVWWSTELECLSAISRREREQADASRIRTALQQLGLLAASWNEVAPTSALREGARRLVRVHPLRAADALQLAAAMALGGSTEFFCLDARLRDAASREGLTVLP